MITHLVKETRQQKEGRWLDKMWKKGGGEGVGGGREWEYRGIL